jgi:glycosyltransferase involved in cell wall biosynthesis
MAQVSLILTTHNSPRALEFVLAGYARQDVRPDLRAATEIIIADDGSRDETRDTIRRLRRELNLPLMHVWQKHRGHYGKPAIVNRAVMAATSDYLILADGDVIPRHDYVRTHLELRRPRTFLAGGDFRLDDGPTKAINLDDVRTGRAFEYSFLVRHGQAPTRRRVKLWKQSWLTRLIDAVNISPARWSGSNASCWKQDLVRVNGFDESFQSWGKDDTELGHRLWNAGVRSRHVRHNAICLHMFHGHGRFTPEGKKINMGLLEETIRTKRTQARVGIQQIVPGDHTIDHG